MRPMGRIPQKQIGDRNRQCRQIHQRMPSAPARAQIVRVLPHDGIEKCVEHQCDEDRSAHQRIRVNGALLPDAGALEFFSSSILARN